MCVCVCVYVCMCVCVRTRVCVRARVRVEVGEQYQAEEIVDDLSSKSSTLGGASVRNINKNRVTRDCLPAE